MIITYEAGRYQRAAISRNPHKAPNTKFQIPNPDSPGSFGMPKNGVNRHKHKGPNPNSRRPPAIRFCFGGDPIFGKRRLFFRHAAGTESFLEKGDFRTLFGYFEAFSTAYEGLRRRFDSCLFGAIRLLKGGNPDKQHMRGKSLSAASASRQVSLSRKGENHTQPGNRLLKNCSMLMLAREGRKR
jgi:hypothetical protein